MLYLPRNNKRLNPQSPVDQLPHSPNSISFSILQST